MNTPASRSRRLRTFWQEGGPLVSYGVAILAFAVCGAIFFENLRAVRDQERHVSHTQDVLTHLERIQTLLNAAETGQRGYLLLGQTEYLSPYHAAQADLDTVFRETRLLLKDNSAQTARLMLVESLTSDKLSGLDETIRLYGSGQKEQAVNRIRTEVGKAVMDEIHTALTLMRDTEAQLLKSRRMDADDAYRQAIVLGWLSGFLGFSLVMASLLFVSRQLLRRSLAEGEVRRQSGQIRLLSEVISRIAMVRDTSSVLTMAAQEIRQLIPCRLAILRLDVPRTQYTFSTATGTGVELELGVVKQLVELGISDQSEDLILTSSEVEGLMPVQTWPDWLWLEGRAPSLMRVPLRGRHRRQIGVLQLVEKLSEEFTAHDRLIAVQFASALAIAVQNALLIEELHQTDQRKDEFLAMLGHELRNPLAGIVTGIEALQFHPANTMQAAPGVELCHEQEDLKAVIARQASHMARLVDDLLDVSRIARGKIPIRRIPLDLRQLISQVITDFRSAHPRPGDLEWQDQTNQTPIWVDADATRLSQCLVNLLTNAMKFSKPDAPIIVELKLAEDGGKVRIAVKDQGIGLEPEDLQEVFEVFRQVNPDIDRGAGGLGLGLALVKGLVHLHGGAVKADSDGAGKGTTFTITLPMCSPGKSPSRVPALSSTPAALASPTRVLLIDDRRDSLLPLRVLLTRDGHTVFEAADGTSGLDVARREQPAVILCDIGLPGGMSGYDVAKAIREESSLESVYLVAVSGYGQKHDIRDAALAGFDFHSTKPVSQSVLRRLLSERPRFEPNAWLAE